MEPWPGRPEVCKSADLLAPEGLREIIGGRSASPNLTCPGAHSRGEPAGEAFQWYLDLAGANGRVPDKAGSGLGGSEPGPVAWASGGHRATVAGGANSP